MKTFLFVAFSLLLTQATAASYPTTYPFENEVYVPEKLPASTPSLTFDDLDVGGYIYTYSYTLQLDEVWPEYDAAGFGFCWSMTGDKQFILVNFYKIGAFLPEDNWNCTKKGNYFVASDYTGDVNGFQVCEVGNCCQQFYGTPKYTADQPTDHELLNKVISSNVCDASSMLEDLYCVQVSGHSQMNCIEQYVSATDRLFMIACHDIHVAYWMSCPVIKNVGLVILTFEPPLYYSLCTPEQLTSVEAVVFNVDRICRPYSYYSPAETGSSTVNSGSASSSASVQSTTSTTSGALLSGVIVSFTSLLIL